MDVSSVSEEKTDIFTVVEAPTDGIGQHVWSGISYVATAFRGIGYGLLSPLNGWTWRSNPEDQVQKYSVAVKCIRACLPEGIPSELQFVVSQLDSVDLQDDRQRYKAFYQTLGDFLKADHEHEVAQDLAQIAVTKVNLSFHINQHLSKIVGSELPEHPLEQIQAVKEAPQELKGPRLTLYWQSFKAATGWEFDAAGMGNLPGVQFVINTTERPVECIHMGLPVIEKCWSNQVDPVFRGFLAARKREERPHLYICLLDITHGEASWWDELAGLRDGYPLQLVALAQDSSFAVDKSEIATLEYRNAFKAEILGGRKKGYHFPDGWMEDNQFTEEIQRIVDQVYTVHFSGVKRLDGDARAAYKQLVDALIVDYLVRNMGYESFTIACRDSADRTARLKSVWTFLLSCATPNVITSVANSSILGKKRALKACRLDDLKSAYAFMEENREACQELMALRPGFQVEGIHIPPLPFE